MQDMNVFNEQKLKLYHGSKSGLHGEIKPCSRKKCDFGAGFYLGDKETQPKSLVSASKYANSKFYEVSLDLKDLTIYKLETDILWALFIAYNRQIIEFPQVFIEKFKLINSYDLIIGVIADDSMTTVLTEFYNDALTDSALLEALQYVQLGNQYVLKTEKTCNQVKILKESNITIQERNSLNHEAIQRRNSMQQVIRNIRAKHLRDGRYFSEIIGGSLNV